MTEAYFLTAEFAEQTPFTKTTWLGQIFTPRLTHIIEYAWVELEAFGWVEGTRLSIHPVLAGDQIHPVRLTTQTVGARTLEKFPPKKRIQFRLNPWTLLAATKYAIVLSIDPQWSYVLVNATYDPYPSAYPPGKLIRSSNAGDTWDTTNLGDLYFAEWGDPPLRKTEPEVPMTNFAVLDITLNPWNNGVLFRIPTSIPCHLTFYYTDKPPLTHVRTATLRGINIPWSQYFCFVSWQAIEQIEAGDTLYHTFYITPWELGNTKWFTFRGNIDAILSPSVGPIFQHTHLGGLPLEQYTSDTYSTYQGIGTIYTRRGQRFTNLTSKVISIRFRLWRNQFPTGATYATIRNSLTDAIIAVAPIPLFVQDITTGWPEWYEFTFPDVHLNNQDIRIALEYTGPVIFMAYSFIDEIPGIATIYQSWNNLWVDTPSSDTNLILNPINP